MKMHFKTNTLLKNLVGKDLINEDNIAIGELVKNSYDAGSTEITVTFKGLLGDENTKRKIIISDKGSGMDLDGIRDRWLNIAYSEKKNPNSKNGAFLAGNKGIGRFSCDRLGTKLSLITKVNGGDILHLKIDWKEFEVEGEKDKLIQDIELDVINVSDEQACVLAGKRKFPESGTVLVISDLRSEWSKEKILDLKKSLEKILNPNQLFLRNSLKIKLIVKDYPDLEGVDYIKRVNGEIKNQVFERLQFNSTYIESNITSDGLISTELHHDGNCVFKVIEINSTYKLLSNARVVIYFLNPYKKAYFKRQTGMRSLDFGSIFLFLNGYRVAPYGESGNDWLGLDLRRAQGHARHLGNRDIVGRIEVIDGEDNFMPVSSREGLKRTRAFDQLKNSFFIDTLKRLEKFVVDGLGWDSVPISMRENLKKEEGLSWEDTNEKYSESHQKKTQRIVLSMMTLIGTTPDKIKSFWFNPALLEEVYKTRSDEVEALIGDLEKIDPRKIDASFKSGVSKIRALIEEKDAEAKSAKKEASTLRVSVAEATQQIAKLVEEKDTFRAQTLFLQSVASVDSKDLMAFHHQIVHDSTIVGNFLGRTIRSIRGGANPKDCLDFLNKAVRANTRIATVAQFATKANFRASTLKEPTDIPSFFEQYIERVAKDFVATNISVDVKNNVGDQFKINVSRIELSILIDNLINNADKADAKKLQIYMGMVDNNTLRVAFIDNGIGLSKSISNVDSIFEIGVSTTSGSGIGLSHCRDIMEKIGGRIYAIDSRSKGFEIIMEFVK